MFSNLAFLGSLNRFLNGLQQPRDLETVSFLRQPIHDTAQIPTGSAKAKMIAG